MREKCKFRITLKLLNIRNPGVPGFYAKNNFEIKSINSVHTCTGYETEAEAEKLYDMPTSRSRPKLLNTTIGPLKFDYDT